jgi:exopolyphosphatase / guanosine-5'-triphosphate,3'-diphosphate pyrophosphatase
MTSGPHVSDAIVPRWEWRTFGEGAGQAERHLAGLTPERVQESDEVYLLAPESEASVKVRAGHLDVKRLEHAGGDGLQLWKPVMKAAFPLPAEDVLAVVRALGAAAPELARSEYTLDEFLAEVVDPAADLLAVKVHKRREHFTVDGCMAELSEMRADGRTARSFAVESEDPARVLAAVRDLGLLARSNVSVPRELKAMTGVGSRRYAVIDVGTNSVKFHVGERSMDGRWLTVVDRAAVTRLGEGLDRDGRLGNEPIRRTVDAIADMAQEATRNRVEAIAAVATAGVRLAPNRAELVDAVRERTGIEVEVISGEEEGRLAYLATASELALGEGSLVVFDTGGGSSQFTIGHDERVDERFSVNVGAVRFTERYGLDGVVAEDALASALDAIAAELSRLDGRPAPERVAGMGGAVTNLAAVKHELATYDRDVVHGTVLDRAEIDRQIELYRTRDADQRREITGLQPERAEVILAGACIVRTILGKFGCASFTVSDRGLRHGVLVERFSLPGA